MKRLLMTFSLVLLGAGPPMQAQPSPPAEELLIALAGLKALVKDYGHPTTVMAPKLGDGVSQLALSVGARQSSVEGGLRCTRTVRGIDCHLVEKGTNIIVRSILARGELRVAFFEIQKQVADEHMSTIIKMVTLHRKEGRWQVQKIEPGPMI